jgi:hypothetical protein
MASFLEIAALVIASAFAGAAFYINAAEHPARMTLPIGAAIAQWKPAYKRGYAMQATLAMVGSLAAFGAAYLSGDWRWWLGGALLLANWPYTLIVIMPVNKKLMQTSPDSADDATRTQLQHWNSLHAGRTLLGAAAASIMIWTVLS